MAKKRKAEEKDNGGSWLASYADMVTIMFALFVLLYALSEVNEELLVSFALAFSGAGSPAVLDFGGDGINDLLGHGIIDMPAMDMSLFQITPDAGGPGYGQGGPSVYEIVGEALRTYFGETAFGDATLADVINVEIDEDTGVLISFFGGMLFDSGRSDLRPDTLPVLATVALEIAAFPELNIAIEGHTDNVPINTAQYSNNWWLSNARATSVLQYFYYGNFNIHPARLSAQGFGEYRPIASNLTEEGRQLNRRVEIRLFQP